MVLVVEVVTLVILPIQVVAVEAAEDPLFMMVVH